MGVELTEKKLPNSESYPTRDKPSTKTATLA